MDVVQVCRGWNGVIGTRSVDTGVNSALMMAQNRRYDGLVTFCDL